MHAQCSWHNLVGLDAEAEAYVAQCRAGVLDRLAHAGIENLPNGEHAMQFIRAFPFPYRMAGEIVHVLNPARSTMVQDAIRKGVWVQYRHELDPQRPRVGQLVAALPSAWNETERQILLALGEEPLATAAMAVSAANEEPF